MADADRRFMSGTEALVELPLLQRARDAAAGLDTAGFVSGYRGSPLGNYDYALTAAADRLAAANVRFQPGLNEDLAATSVWGTQQVGLFPGAIVAGVFGIWYGKGPGVDRSLDALKHGNAAGTSEHGGVLLIAGDDHGCVSSTLPHQSGPVFAAASIPVLAPSTVAELLDFGLIGIAMSRASGCWVALTCASEVVESSAAVDLEALRPVPVVARGDVGIRWPDPPLAQEARLHDLKLPAAQAFARAAGIDRIEGRAVARLTIVTTGKAYGDVVSALALLGDPPVRLVKVGLAWPLGDWIADWVADAGEVLVVEEKRGFVEDQLALLLANRPFRPSLIGKRDHAGAPLLAATGELGARQVAAVIAARLSALTGATFDLPPAGTIAPDPLAPVRAPFFCAGCPHNTSTVVPDGSRAMGGIGCHGMATWTPDRNTQLLTQMGAEGATWIGQAPFTTERHVFQNMGDGTYNHSGLLAIRAAVAAGVNITYKILYNDAVAMTGGQPHEGALTVEAIAAQLLAEGVREVAVVAEQPDRFARGALPGAVALHPRAKLDTVQRDLRTRSGVTAIIYDQTCAAELRRRRRTEPALRRKTHVVINPDVCEGCGDCSLVSNCIAIQPLETPLGRKRRVDPAACNQDYSCLQGFCPSFVTVEADASTGVAVTAPPRVAAPDIPEGASDIVIAGIGGTGVVTVGAILAEAAKHDSVAVSILDLTGLSQKNGAVLTQVRLGGVSEGAVRVEDGKATLMIGCDLVAAGMPAALSRCGRSTTIIGNADVAPTSAFVRDRDADDGGVASKSRLRERIGGAFDLFPATTVAAELTGSAIGANIMLLGAAWQRGLIPLTEPAMRDALATAAPGGANRAAFDWGRALAADTSLYAAPLAPPSGLASIVEDRVARLTTYHDRRLADAFRARVDRVAATFGAELGADYAHALYRLTAIKDEYEVARLLTLPAFEADLARRFGSTRPSYHLAPPFLGSRKRRFGSWLRPVLLGLSAARRVRNSWADPFRYTRERREDRALLTSFEREVDRAVDVCDRDRLDAMIAATTNVRGFGHVRAAGAARYHAAVNESSNRA